MSEKDKLHDSEQDNDGIHEYDNPLPGWFLYMFYASILFAGLYYPYYIGYNRAIAEAGGVGANLSASGGDYLAAVRREEEAHHARPATELNRDELLEILKAPASISGGEAVFKANCVACHGDHGQGVVGPNLTDAYWLHGGGPEGILASVTHGYPDKGMPAWKNVLGGEKVRLAAAYVLSLKGRNVANPKAPQGIEER
ncbi:MAG: c-type cytochrome [Fibrobacteria bacterium]|jgi:cytochrome c oxidase cbb3-type subunit 3